MRGGVAGRAATTRAGPRERPAACGIIAIARSAVSIGGFLRSAAGIRVPLETQKLMLPSGWIQWSGTRSKEVFTVAISSGAVFSKMTSRGREHPCAHASKIIERPHAQKEAAQGNGIQGETR